MRKTLMTAAAVLMTVPGLAHAASTTTSTTTPADTTPANTTPATSTSSAPGMSIRHHLMSSLEQSGFTDIKVMPDSFIVHAKDKSGRPISMFISPDAVAEVTPISAGTSAANEGDTGSQASTAEHGSVFTSVPPKEDLSSKVVGLDVYNKANQDIGTIKDIAFSDRGVKAYIVGVGGFLGMGDRYVAVSPQAIDVSYDATAKKWHATMDTNADQLKQAPQYKYSSES